VNRGVVSNRTLPSIAVLAGDLACFFIFAVVGLRSHEDGITASGVLRAAIPFQVGWVLFGLAFGLLRPRRRLLASRPRPVLVAWLPAWLLGLSIRTFILGRAFAPTFAVVALLFNGVLLLLWRSLLLARYEKSSD